MSKKKALLYPEAKAQAEAILKKALNETAFESWRSDYAMHPEDNFENTLWFESKKFTVIVIEKEALKPFPHD